ncbi:PREDICTED: protein HEXIM1 [Gekko japonicus]|uniref:Protein HEXIM1 n=1 Tax=Gekko japonicus TaxID=146911 RepID=A0ABM1KYQ8_GEKJA|nr:PREDICTED: protein HEXIM1 [Gekko japonicus]
MTDAVLSASGGRPAPFSATSGRRAGGGGPFPESPPPDPELPGGGEPLDGRWRPREAPQPGADRPDGEGAVEGDAPPLPPAGASQGCDGAAGGRSQDPSGGVERGPPEDAPCPGSVGGPWGPRWRPASGGEEEQPPRQVGKKKHRRRPSKKKRHWKPYYKLSWEEKQRFDEKQSQRASRLRAEMFAKGQPVAPYNTTQFLMEDHDQEEPDLKTAAPPGPRRAAHAHAAAPKSDDNPSSGAEEDGFFAEEEEELAALDGSDGMGGEGSEFLQKDFSETYERYHVESLQNMSKQELVREYLELEKCLSRMEEENNRLRLENKRLGGGGGGEDLRLRPLEQELDRLRAEKGQLDGRQQGKPPPEVAAGE